MRVYRFPVRLELFPFVVHFFIPLRFLDLHTHLLTIQPRNVQGTLAADRQPANDTVDDAASIPSDGASTSESTLSADPANNAEQTPPVASPPQTRLRDTSVTPMIMGEFPFSPPLPRVLSLFFVADFDLFPVRCSWSTIHRSSRCPRRLRKWSTSCCYSSTSNCDASSFNLFPPYSILFHRSNLPSLHPRRSLWYLLSFSRSRRRRRHGRSPTFLLVDERRTSHPLSNQHRSTSSSHARHSRSTTSRERYRRRSSSRRSTSHRQSRNSILRSLGRRRSLFLRPSHPRRSRSLRRNPRPRRSLGSR